MYLWHYPVFAFARINSSFEGVINLYGLPIQVKYLFILLTLGLSIISYFLIEKPFRSIKFNTKAVLYVLVISFIGIASINLTILKHEGFKERGQFIALKYYFPNFELDRLYLDQQKSLFQQKYEEIYSSYDNNNKANVLIVGDSFGEDLTNAFIQNLDLFKKNNFRFLDYLYFTDNELVGLDDKYKEADIVVFSGSWISRHSYVSEVVEGVESLLKFSNGKKIFVTSNSNVYVNNLSQNENETIIDTIVKENKSDLKNFDIQAYKNHYFAERGISSDSDFNVALRKFSENNGITFLNREDYMCDLDKRECDYLTPEGYKIFFDKGHTTVEGAKYFGKKIYASSWFKVE